MAKPPFVPEPPVIPTPGQRPENFIPPRPERKPRKTRIAPSKITRPAGACPFLDPVGRQCQLEMGHATSHMVRYPGSRGPYAYRWGAEPREG